MPATKNQIKRLEILDELLGRKKCSQGELLSYINERLTDEGNAVDKRTLFRDIKYLIEEKNAPIHRPEKGDEYYYYSTKFSIKNVLLDEDDVAVLKKAAVILRQVETFQMIDEMETVIRKLENRLHTHSDDQTSLIQFEKHTSSFGHEYIDNLMDAIESKIPIKISYQPFIFKESSEKIVHPYLLKEFRNRWFLIGRDGDSPFVSNYALDRIKKIRNSDATFIENNLYDPDHYFDFLIGVSIPRGSEPELIEIKVFKPLAPYVISKPIHYNQEILRKNKDGSILVSLRLFINFELKSILLSHGAGLQVKSPVSLRKEMVLLTKAMYSLYRS
jgi:predicted DNA-binding transcriptional regulator YafY